MEASSIYRIQSDMGMVGAVQLETGPVVIGQEDQ